MRKLLVLSVAHLLVTAASGAISGSCEESATQASDSRAFSTVLEYDSETGRYDPETYVYYFKATLKRGNAYTVWLEDADGKLVEDGSIYIENAYAADSSDAFPPSASFWECAVGGGQYVWMPASEWTYDPEFPEFNDPESWTYYVRVISGSESRTARLRFGVGVLLPPGIEDNPVNVSPREKAKGAAPDVLRSSDAYKLRGGEFYVSAQLVAGRKYLYALRGGSASDPVTLDCRGNGRISPFENPEAPAGWQWNSIVPNENDSEYERTIFHVSAASNSTASFEFAYSLMPTRSLAEHGAISLEVGASPVTFRTGRISNPAYYAYDEIIDDNLYSFDAVVGERYAIDTLGAKTNLLVRVYDKDGDVLYESSRRHSGYDCRLAFTAGYSGTYYVGVAENLANDDTSPVLGEEVSLQVSSARAVDGAPDRWDAADDSYLGASGLEVVPAQEDDDPLAKDQAGHGWHQLGKTDWYDTFMVAARKDVTYVFRVSLKDGDPDFRLGYDVFRATGGSLYTVRTSGDINPGSLTGLTFTATANAAYYLRLYVKGDIGFDYPDYKVHAIGYAATGVALGSIKVDPKGANSATWSLNSENVSYPAGACVLLPAGGYSVKYAKVAGFRAPDNRQVDLKAGDQLVFDKDNYTDTFDHKDDEPGKATSWSLKNVATVQERTLWNDDPADHFTFAGKDGQYYDFDLERRARDESDTPDAVFSILRGSEVLVENVTSVHQMELPKAKEKYYLVVTHENEGPDNNCSYALTGYFAAVGQLKFAKTAVSVKDSVGIVSLAVKRTAKDGRVRVRYSTADGTAKAGEKYVAQAGELVWEDGDNKDKTISIKLIPKLRPVYEGGASWSFKVKLEVPDDLSWEEYPPSFNGPTEATVTISDASNKNLKTPEDNYKPVKKATVKTEKVALRSGTFYGVATVTNDAEVGYMKLASVSVTVGAKDRDSSEEDTLSAKVAIGGKTYSFKSDKGEPPWDGREGAYLVKSLVSGELTLKIRVPAEGVTDEGDGWQKAVGKVELVDADGEAVAVYAGDIYRNCTKIQGCLDQVVKFSGYYTVALAPQNAASGRGLPSGNGYVTMTLDPKGKVKIAGMLPDGTKLSFAVPAMYVVADPSSGNGFSVLLPLYASAAKAQYCFGGTLRLFAEGKDDLGRDLIVVDSTSSLAWVCDDESLSYDGLEGFSYEIAPVGGYFDTVINLQRNYIDYAATIKTADVMEFPAETFTYEPVSAQQPNGFSVGFNMNNIELPKKSIVKDDSKLIDFEASANPANIVIKFARATGVVSGSFSLWSQGYDANDNLIQKEIKGIKHFGIMLLARDKASHAEFSEKLSENVISAGFMQLPLNVQDELTEKIRKWTFSDVFNIVK